MLISHLSLRLLRKFYNVFILDINKVRKEYKNNNQLISNPEATSEVIFNLLNSSKPCMICRFGNSEFNVIQNYLGVISTKFSILDFIQSKSGAYWWEKNIVNQLCNWSGFFPEDENLIKKFCILYLENLKLVDLMGIMLRHPHMERNFQNELQNKIKMDFELLNPFFSKNPWTKALEGKKVLVIHPFTNSIEKQYKKRKQLFDNDLLPEFELKTIKAVQSIASEKTRFQNWFEALDWMKIEMAKVDYDIALIGCGAYGYPLAAHAKKKNKKGFHVGGSLQLLFGIMGKRWENKNYNDAYDYSKLVNEHWIKPADEEIPKNHNSVEDSCYW